MCEAQRSRQAENDERCKNNVAHWRAECALFILLCNTSVTLRVSRDGTCTSFYRLILAFVTGREGDRVRRSMGHDVKQEDTHKTCFSYEIEGMLNALFVWSIKTFVWCWFKGQTAFCVFSSMYLSSVCLVLSIDPIWRFADGDKVRAQIGRRKCQCVICPLVCSVFLSNLFWWCVNPKQRIC